MPNTHRSPLEETGSSRESARLASVHPRASTDSWLEDEVDLQRYRRALRRQWKLLAAGVLIGAIAGLTFALRRPVLYEAVTTMLVDQTNSPAAISTSRALLQNYTLATETINETGLNRPPYNVTPQGFVDDLLQIEEVRGTNLVKVKVRLQDPARAAHVSQLLSRKAVVLNRRIATEGSNGVREQLKVHLDGALARLKVTEQQLLTYQSEAQVEVLKTDTDALLNQREDLLKLGIEIEGEKARLAAAEQEIQKQEPVLAVRRSVGSEEALRRAARPANSGLADPELLDLSNPVANPVYQVLAFQIATSRTRLAGFERQRREMVEVRKVGAHRFTELTDLYRRRIDIARLQQDHDIAQRVYDELALRYEQSRAQALGTMVQLQIVDEAIPPERPLARRRAASAALGGLAGLLVAGLGALVRDRDPRSNEVPRQGDSHTAVPSSQL